MKIQIDGAPYHLDVAVAQKAGALKRAFRDIKFDDVKEGNVFRFTTDIGEREWSPCYYVVLDKREKSFQALRLSGGSHSEGMTTFGDNSLTTFLVLQKDGTWASEVTVE